LDIFLKRLKRYCPKINFLWIIEFQKRGAPHFHILVDHEIGKDWLSQNWYEIVNSKDLKHLKAGTTIQAVQKENLVMAYLTDYIKKLEQKTVPEEYLNVGRFWGHTKNILKSSDYIITSKKTNNLKKDSRLLRRWYKAQMRIWGYKWKWKGQGFIAWEGIRFFNELEKRSIPDDLIGLIFPLN